MLINFTALARLQLQEEYGEPFNLTKPQVDSRRKVILRRLEKGDKKTQKYIRKKLISDFPFLEK